MTHLFDWLADPDLPPPNRKNLPEYVFRYMDANGLRHTVNDKRLRLNCWSAMNDPRESKQWASSGILRATGTYTEEAMHSRLDDVLRRSARLAALTADRQVAPSAASGSLFHRGWAHAALWSHYGDRHHGVCLVIDPQSLIDSVFERQSDNNTKFTNWGWINYVDKPITVDFAGEFSSQEKLDVAIEEFLGQRWKQSALHMTKSCDWSYENEVRIAAIDLNLPDDKLDTAIKVPLGDCLKAVIFGDEHAEPRELAVETQPALGSSAPEFFRCRWNDGTPSLEPLDLGH